MGLNHIVVQVIVIAAVFGVLFLTLVRPQQQRLKQHQLMLDNLRLGDQVYTTGGLVGTIVDMSNNATAVLDIAEHTRVTVLRKSIDGIVSTGRVTSGESTGVETDLLLAVQRD